MADQVRSGHSLRRRIAVIAFGLILAWPVALWGVSYQASQKLWHSQVRGCERGRLDREDNVRGWEAAKAARAKTAVDPSVSRAEREAASLAVAEYQRTIVSLRSRVDPPFDCKKVFPKPGLLG